MNRQDRLNAVAHAIEQHRQGHNLDDIIGKDIETVVSTMAGAYPKGKLNALLDGIVQITDAKRKEQALNWAFPIVAMRLHNHLDLLKPWVEEMLKYQKPHQLNWAFQKVINNYCTHNEKTAALKLLLTHDERYDTQIVALRIALPTARPTQLDSFLTCIHNTPLLGSEDILSVASFVNPRCFEIPTVFSHVLQRMNPTDQAKFFGHRAPTLKHVILQNYDTCVQPFWHNLIAHLPHKDRYPNEACTIARLIGMDKSTLTPKHIRNTSMIMRAINESTLNMAFNKEQRQWITQATAQWQQRLLNHQTQHSPAAPVRKRKI